MLGDEAGSDGEGRSLTLLKYVMIQMTCGGRLSVPVVSIFSSSESVIEDKTINDSIPADLFTVKVDFGIKFLDRRI